MNGRAVSPVFAGRDAELAVLAAAYERACGAGPAVVLVGGEAGVGKSRLVREFAAGVRAGGARVLEGGGQEHGADGLPLAAFVTALRRLVRELGAEQVAALLPGGSRALARLLPDLGEPEPDTEVDAGYGRARLFQEVLTVLERIAERQPLVLVVEDAHWADPSSWDLLVFLAHNLSEAQVLLIVTYRSEEVDRAHPLRWLLAELARAAWVDRLELSGLSSAEVARQLAGLLGREPDAALAERVFTRSDGNPLFVEALVGAADDATSLAEPIRELLLAGIERLPDDSRLVVRAAAVSGGPVGQALLRIVTGLDDAPLLEALRAAVDRQVLVAADDGYVLRHALLREVLYDDLLPGDRERLHARYAEALERDPGLVPDGRAPVELAAHTFAARDSARALLAAWRAAAAAVTTFAYGEQLRMLNRVLELWNRVPDAAERLGVGHAEVLEVATHAAYASGEPEQGVALATAALQELDAEQEPLRAALVLGARGLMQNQLGEYGFDDLRAAVRLVPADPPSAARGRALATLARALYRAPEAAEARASAEAALSIGRQLGDAVTQAHALLTVAALTASGGDLDAASAAFAEAAAIAEQAGADDVVLLAAILEASELHGAGAHEQAVIVARQGVAVAQRVGLVRTRGSYLAVHLAEPLIALGRWQEAREVLQHALALAPPPSYRARLLTLTGELALATGELDRAADAVTTAKRQFSDRYVTDEDVLPLLQLECELHLARGDPDLAAGVVDRVLEGFDLSRSPRFGWPLLGAGARACREQLVRARAIRQHTALKEATQRLTVLAAQSRKLPVVGRLQQAHRATFAGELLAAQGKPDLTAWDVASAAWQDLAQPHQRALALVQAAETAIGSGGRAAATARLQAAASIADRLAEGGAIPLRRQIDLLAQRARIPLPAAGTDETAGLHEPAGPAQRWRERLGLSPRELEVLRLVAAGRSNRQIAEELFISVKTASVHVSNILAKLDVTTRVEAAALAHRLRVFEPTAGD
jgi:DNA-binding CsgD family transcriptional regulator/tetratricopeptide (TPR) repeat protein